MWGYDGTRIKIDAYRFPPLGALHNVIDMNRLSRSHKKPRQAQSFLASIYLPDRPRAVTPL